MAEGKIRFRALTHGHYPEHLLPPWYCPASSSVGHLDARGEQDWGLDPHCNEGIEISLLETGHMGFTVDAREYLLMEAVFGWCHREVAMPCFCSTGGNIFVEHLKCCACRGADPDNPTTKMNTCLIASLMDADEIVVAKVAQPLEREGSLSSPSRTARQ